MSSPAISSTNPNSPAPLQARAVAGRYEGPSPIDLARMAAEEEFKRKLAGGGGGGSAAMKSPTQFVLYSMSLINDQMRAMYQAVIKAFEANQANAPQQAAAASNVLPAGLRETITNIANGLRMLGDAMQRASQMPRDATKSATEFLRNAANIATLTMSSWVSRMLKALGLSKLDDENFEAEDIAEKFAMTEEERIARELKANFYTQGGDDGRTVLSHIQNVADQMNRVVASLLRR